MKISKEQLKLLTDRIGFDRYDVLDRLIDVVGELGFEYSREMIKYALDKKELSHDDAAYLMAVMAEDIAAVYMDFESKWGAPQAYPPEIKEPNGRN